MVLIILSKLFLEEFHRFWKNEEASKLFLIQYLNDGSYDFSILKFLEFVRQILIFANYLLNWRMRRIKTFLEISWCILI